MTFKKILGHVLTALLAAALLICCWYGHHVWRLHRGQMHCTRLEVKVKDSLSNRFIAPEDIGHIIERNCGKFTGRKLDSLDIDAIEKAVLTHTAVRSAEAYAGADSCLHVVVTQKVPVLRFQRSDGGFYIDDRGQAFPLQARGTASVPIVDGAIPAELTQEWIKGIIGLEKYIQSNKTWRDNIVQVHIEDNGDLVLIPREGREKFIFGGYDECERKFSQMEKYYTCIKPAVEDGLYGSVNLKFENQIICRR